MPIILDMLSNIAKDISQSIPWSAPKVITWEDVKEEILHAIEVEEALSTATKEKPISHLSDEDQLIVISRDIPIYTAAVDVTTPYVSEEGMGVTA